MGQKINPLGFRLGTNQSHNSLWFAKKKMFSVSLKEDGKIRNYINNYIKKKSSLGLKGVTRIIIYKQTNLIQIQIFIGFLKLFIEDLRFRIKELKTDLKKQFYSINRRLNITITRIEKPYGEPKIIAEYISLQLKNRVSFKKAIKKTIELTEQTDIKGIQVKIAGRIDGKEIARVEWIREGRVPLQTIRAKINYCSYTIRTIYGALGIKIWVYVGEDK
uniref:Small ribosomal subunit protein uS3c n=1 Tax=Arachnitis uniflora TaxID=191246 RepID=A0A0K1H2Z7_9LILI|nr:ribosomal protein S3 [Arachnitis uniflora]